MAVQLCLIKYGRVPGVVPTVKVLLRWIDLSHDLNLKSVVLGVRELLPIHNRIKQWVKATRTEGCPMTPDDEPKKKHTGK